MAPPRGVCFQFTQSGSCRFGMTCKFTHSGPLFVLGNNLGTGGKEKSKRAPRKRGKTPHLDSFFAQYPDFLYDPSAPVMQHFYDMCDEFGWEREDEEKKTAHMFFREALVEQFNEIYGTDVDDINSWQKLCTVLKISPIPEDLAACRDAVADTHVNLIDLVDTVRTEEEVEIFESVKELSEYTKRYRKFFPRDEAYGGVLQFLLRHILFPESDPSYKKASRRRRRRA